jgi:hypothetical protein
MIIKIDKLLTKLTKRKREKIQVNKIGDEKRVIITNINEIQRITKEYFEDLYSKKLENLEEMINF